MRNEAIPMQTCGMAAKVLREALLGPSNAAATASSEPMAPSPTDEPQAVKFSDVVSARNQGKKTWGDNITKIKKKVEAV
eukprot:11204683-Lingulodinium_polyedra.AAC.1